jgi:DNA-binding CsgD family transcriptional regulator
MKICHFAHVWPALSQAETTQDLRRVVSSFVRAEGFTFWAYAQSATDGTYFAINNYPSSWIHRYDAIGDADPAVAHVRAGLPPAAWNDAARVAGARIPITKRIKQLLGEAGEHGLRSGITAPVFGPNLRWGLFTVALRGREAPQSVAEHIPRVFAFGTFLRARVDELTAVPGGPHLTPRELQCLQLASQGLTSKKIGTKLEITPGVVDHHLWEAGKKLAVRGRVAAASRAMLLGLI